MRRVIVLATALVLVVAACGTDGGPDDATAPAAKAMAGEIEVTATPQTAETGTVIRVVFDTHSVDLDFDPLAIATLDTGGREVRAGAWDGAGPGGHHLEGDLVFDVEAEPSDMALTLELDPPVTLTWEDR
jgi:hypothetical protein